MAEIKPENRKETNDSLKEDAWEIDIKEVIYENQRQRRPSSHPCCIYRAHILRDVDTAAFTPKIVSIGPLHHFQPHLKGMEETKINYLEQFLQHADNTARLHEQQLNNLEEKMAFLGWKGNKIQGGNDFTLLGELFNILQSSEKDIRSSYAENLNHIGSEEFLRLVLVDAAFIIELFLRDHFCSQDYELEDTMLPPLYQFIIIRCDLWLLENQLPFFILESLYAFAFGSDIEIYPPFFELTLKFFKEYNQGMMEHNIVVRKAEHFTDLLRAFFLQSLGNSKEEQNSEENLDTLLRDNLPSATQLYDVGVKFIATQNEGLLDIKFSESSGRLEIPCVHLWDETADCFRNLIALEQNHYPYETLVSDYFTLMDYLIDTREDVDLLMQNKVIKHWLGSSSEVASLFNSLCKNITKGMINPRYREIITQLNKYHSRRLHRWKAILRQQYFNTPWRAASTTAAIIFLVLTFAQTILAGLALKPLGSW